MSMREVSPATAASATALVRAFSRELALEGGLLSPDYLESGLSLGEARCLYELGHAAGLTVSELAGQLGLDLGYVSRVVTRLAAQGLVEKRSEARDRRARRVTLTRSGKRRLGMLDKCADHRLGAWLDSKPAVGVAELVNGLHTFLGSAPHDQERITIHDARPGDVGHIIARHGQLYVQEFAYPTFFEAYVVEAFAKFFKDYSPLRDRVFVAEREGRFVGSVAMKGLPRAVAQLRFLLVEPTARGAGLGRRLVRAAIDHARASGERRILLETASNLDAARALYAAHGFRRTRAIDGAPWLPANVQSETWQLELEPGSAT